MLVHGSQRAVVGGGGSRAPIRHIGGRASILDLQRGAGNAAVAHRLQREEANGVESPEGSEGAAALGTCTGTSKDDVKYEEKAFKVNATGLSDLHDKVQKKFGGLAGHVETKTLSWSATCSDGGLVGTATVTAKGHVNLPERGTVTTSTADPTREETGITNYFDIVQKHEKAHAKIFTDAFTGLAAKLVGKSQTDAQAEFDAAACAAYKAHDTLDNKEGCVELCCTTGAAKDATKAPASNCGLTPNAADSCASVSTP